MYNVAEALEVAAGWAALAGDASEAAATNAGPSADRPQTKIFNIYIFYNSVSRAGLPVLVLHFFWFIDCFVAPSYCMIRYV